jgi:hypothetical protein
MVYPTHLFPQVGVFVNAGLAWRAEFAEGGFMETGGAGRHYHPIHQAVFKILDDHFLAGIGAHEHIGPGHHHPRHLAGLLANLFHVHGIGNIAAAIADVNPHFAFRDRTGVRINLSREIAFRRHVSCPLTVIFMINL